MITIDFNKFIIFASEIFNYLFKKPIQKTQKIMNPTQAISNNYFSATDLQPSLDNAVLTAQANLKPYQDALDLAIMAQSDNVTLSENLKAQILQALNPITPVVSVVPAPETETPV